MIQMYSLYTYRLAVLLAPPRRSPERQQHAPRRGPPQQRRAEPVPPVTRNRCRVLANVLEIVRPDQHEVIAVRALRGGAARRPHARGGAGEELSP